MANIADSNAGTGGTSNQSTFQAGGQEAVHTGSGNIHIQRTIIQTPKSSPFMTPPKPVHGVFGRADFLHQIATLLDFERQTAEEPAPVALHGMGGIGKTTLAIALGRRPDIERLFPDGVLWASLGPNPTVRILLDGWGKALGLDLLTERDEVACRHRLSEFLYRRQVLVLIDDVWEAAHGNYFLVAGSQGRTLLTTREKPVANQLATRTRTINVNVLQPADALLLLQGLAPEVVASNFATAQQLCERVEYLPLALTLAGRYLANSADIPGRMERLLGELVERRNVLQLQQSEPKPGIDEKMPSLQAILGLSVERLNRTDQERFAMASVFGGEPLTWDIKAAAFVWECSVDEAEETTLRFIHRGLVTALQNNRYWMHALLAEYATALMEEMKL